ncbi:NAD(P)/FAD-dependent oxidoreductase [Piscinibacter sakaiensis]|uniref:NAD(P)/FAD-dependent oxidoreductase n=1 Tax=Piscinibacter sakaiensis TaxID=1547922 RepID=UPI003AAAC84F
MTPESANADAGRLNRPLDELPSHCDVLVVGAGPAGSAAAQLLARAGFDVVMIDRQAFPRDKVCGDGLIPDAHRALRRLGVLDEVLLAGRRANHVAAIGPRGGRIDVPGQLAVLPRKQLDLILCRAATAAGARMFAPLRFSAAIHGNDHAGQRVVGARVDANGMQREIRARWTILATGAVPQALQAVGMCRRRAPSAVAIRGYLHNPALADRVDALEVAWHPSLRGGYGWIFPCGDGLFNIGVGVAHSHGQRDDNIGGSPTAMAGIDLRAMLRSFADAYPPAGELIGSGSWVGELKGAPLRCSLAGADLSRPGLLVAGEAAGSTFAFTGEGIGKALETGMLAARTLIDAAEAPTDDETIRARYEQQVRALQPLYQVYDRANVVNRHPWLVDLLVWSARRSPSRLQRMAGVLDETYMPDNLINVGSLMRLFFERG